jgi:hypothetical protein
MFVVYSYSKRYRMTLQKAESSCLEDMTKLSICQRKQLKEIDPLCEFPVIDSGSKID